MFNSPTYGQLPIREVPERLLEFYERSKMYGRPCSIIVGSDSQNYYKTHAVTVISIVCEGHGGIFFYRKEKIPLIRDVKSKLYAETQRSLEVTGTLIDLLENDPRYAEMYASCPISIHVDAGNSDKGKTAALIPEIVGWVKSMGYVCYVKPDAFVASSIADKISK